MTETARLWRELKRLWPHLLPEKRAQVVETARLLSLSPSTRRLLHELADLEAAQGREGVVRRLRELRASLGAGDAAEAAETAGPEARSAVTGEILGLLDQDHGFEDEVRLAVAQSRLGPTARSFTLQFVEALAAGDLAAAETAIRTAYEQVENELRRRGGRPRRRRGDAASN